MRNGPIWISKRSLTPFFSEFWQTYNKSSFFFAAIFVCMQRYNISKLCHKSVMWTCISFWSTTPLLPGKAQMGKNISECFRRYCFSLNNISFKKCNLFSLRFFEETFHGQWLLVDTFFKMDEFVWTEEVPFYGKFLMTFF